MMLNLPDLEKTVQDYWTTNDTFAKSLDTTLPRWVFLEGPPTMNGQPGVHHVEPRAFKDLFGRYKTMTGHYVPRQAGWDCHGLPVELAVSKELGKDTKTLVDTLGGEAYSQACKDSVEHHQGVFEELTRRMGYWVDLDNPYRTMDPEYMEHTWRTLKHAHEQGLLTKDNRVAPWCTSCATGLSSHEVAQGYETKTDTALTVRLRLTDRDTDLLVWTTTPWTLPENQLVVVHPEMTYVEKDTSRGRVLLAETVSDQVPGYVLTKYLGADLVGLMYHPVLGPRRPGAHRVVAADFVTANEGTGLVHLAPAYGQDDQRVAKEEGGDRAPDLGPDGVYKQGEYEGMHYRTLNEYLLETLGDDAVWARGEVTHRYPHCWRCHEPLVYLSRSCWYLRTTSLSEVMEEDNKQVRWHPESAGTGRYGDWLANNVDWALSRERYWGTPLPVWECPEGHQHAVGDRRELSNLLGTDVSQMDLHRPSVDPLTFPCPTCQRTTRRVSEVVDCWFDSGVAPMTLMGEDGNVPVVDFVCEGVDQTRGWFYALQAVSTLTRGTNAYDRVLCLGHVVDENGEKMSKHKGNVLDPFELFDQHGADAVRWQMLCEGSPWGPRRVSEKSVAKAGGLLRQVWATRALLGAEQAGGTTQGAEVSHPLDRWALSRTQETLSEVTQALEDYDTLRAGSSLTRLVEDLSGRYLRASRTRLQDPTSGAGETLKEVLKTLALLLAPFTPFFAEGLWQELGQDGSVHHQAWPQTSPDSDAAGDVEEVWNLLEEGRTLRAKLGLRQRQPLRRAQVLTRHTLGEDLREVLRSGLNVKELEVNESSLEVRPNWRELGRRYKKETQSMVGLLPRQVPWGTRSVSVKVMGEEVDLTECVELVAPGDQVVLDTDLDDVLLEEGRLMDLMRKVNDLRKEAGLSRGEWASLQVTDTLDRELLERHPEQLQACTCELVEGEAQLVL